jgi:hypothetical protein
MVLPDGGGFINFMDCKKAGGTENVRDWQIAAAFQALMASCFKSARRRPQLPGMLLGSERCLICGDTFHRKG